jgi:hypothetical protein
MSWRIYRGDPNGEWSHVDEVTAVWGEGHERLARELEPFLTDECADCRQQGTEARERLLAASEGTGFEAEVDGELYALTPA